MKKTLTWCLCVLLLSAGLLAACQPEKGPAPVAGETPTRFPGAQWQQYANPQTAGWSETKLAQAERYARAIGSAAVMVVEEGAVVAAWGEVERRFMVASVRKSLLNALYGMPVAKGTMDLDQTLAELQIDDHPSLTAIEKEATLRDLLTSRSGVYHPAAYETALLKEKRPERGSHAPGTFWYYNNWDFNALLTIFEQETGARIFESFGERIATPLQMQDYGPRAGYYHLEPERSLHPAYPFRMSARDLARFGWLYLNEGRWQGEQVVPAAWVAQSTKVQTATDREASYGYLWWVDDDELPGGYFAEGGDTQLLLVLPERKMVIVHLTNSYAGETVSYENVRYLVKLILAAKTGAGSSKSELAPLPENADLADTVSLPVATLARYAGTYRYADGQQVRVELTDGVLTLDFGFGTFGLEPLSSNQFLVVDTRERLTFEELPDGSIGLHYASQPANPLDNDDAVAKMAGRR